MDVIVQFARAKENQRTIEVVGRFGSEAPSVIEFKDGQYQLLGSKAVVSARDAEAAVLKAIDEQVPQEAPQIAQAAKVGLTRTREVLKSLVEAGRIHQCWSGVRNDPWLYSIQSVINSSDREENGINKHPLFDEVES